MKKMQNDINDLQLSGSHKQRKSDVITESKEEASEDLSSLE